jgi:hypothetical protein
MNIGQVRYNGHLQGVVQIRLQFRFIRKQIDGVLVTQNCSVPQDEDDQDVLALSKVQEGSHVLDHGSSTVGSGDVTIAVVSRSIIALNVQPYT